jgi:catechol 2,3-dioxygenase-like lactoylglutathione lyase family enzyme
MKSQVISVRHTGISVHDLDKSLNFYQGLLGLSIINQAEESGCFLEDILALPGVRLTSVKLGTAHGPTLVELLAYKTPKPQNNIKRHIYDIGVSHLALTVFDLNKLYQQLTDAGVIFRSPPHMAPDGHAKVAFCSDPDGTPVELVEQII